MNEDDSPKPKPVTFYVGCPTCGGSGTRNRQRAAIAIHQRPGIRPLERIVEAYVPEHCTDCNGAGRIPLNSGAWKGKPATEPE